MRRRYRQTQQPIEEGKKLIQEGQSSMNSGSFESLQNRFLFVVVIAVIVTTVAALYYAYIILKRYLLARDVEAVVNLVYPSNPTVAETLTCRIRFRRKNNGKLIPSSSQTFRELEESIRICIEPPNNDALTRPVAVLIESNNASSHISGKFSVRKSGIHEIKVKYHIFDIGGTPPFTFEVLPGPVSYKYMDFQIHNSQILCLTAGLQQHFKIMAEDEYGNKCRTQDLDLQQFDFKIYNLGIPFPNDHEFCYHQFDGNHGEGNDTTSDTCTVSACLKLTVNPPGLYTCGLKYGDYEVPGTPGVAKLLVCITQDEEKELRDMFSRLKIPGTLIFTSRCKLSVVGEAGGFNDYYVGISTSSLVFAYYQIPLRLYPDIVFPINARTQILVANQTTGNENIAIQIQDGLRPSLKLEMNLSSARMFLVVFAHNQGLVLPSLRMPFQIKQETLKKQLSTFFIWFKSERILNLQAGNLINSTRKEVPICSSDWLLPFRIQYGGAPPSSKEKSVVSTGKVEEWINRLCDEFFKDRGETAMFQRIHGSRLLHPVSSKVSEQPLENYKLAGQILAKQIVEVLFRGICTQLNYTRFTRSLLAFLLGLPLSFKFLEADEPKYFRKIMKIAELNLTGEEHRFTTCPSSKSNMSVVNLIPNGSDIPVTNENKEHYLNLLTKHRLIHTVEQEITAFRKGFYQVINKDFLCNFREQDLQKLISGGCQFRISDLKAHHRVVKEVDNGSINALLLHSIDEKKVMHWFWTAVENLSEDEQSALLFFVTGSFYLPSCGLSHLNPLFTISLTGTYNQMPKAHPGSNEIVLGDHACFDSFEKSLLQAIKPESERIMLPTSTNILCLQRPCGRSSETGTQHDTEIDGEEWENAESQSQITRSQDASLGDPILNWLRGFVNL